MKKIQKFLTQLKTCEILVSIFLTKITTTKLEKKMPSLILVAYNYKKREFFCTSPLNGSLNFIRYRFSPLQFTNLPLHSTNRLLLFLLFTFTLSLIGSLVCSIGSKQLYTSAKVAMSLLSAIRQWIARLRSLWSRSLSKDQLPEYSFCS